MQYQRVFVSNPNCLVLRVGVRLTTKKCVSYLLEEKSVNDPSFIYFLFHKLRGLASEIYLSTDWNKRVYEIMIDTRIESSEKMVKWEDHIPFIVRILRNTFDSGGKLQEIPPAYEKKKIETAKEKQVT